MVTCIEPYTLPGFSLARTRSWLRATFSSWMNMRSIITISAEGPSLCSRYQAHKRSMNIGLTRSKHQERSSEWDLNDTFDSSKSKWRYLSTIACVRCNSWHETFSNSSSTGQRSVKWEFQISPEEGATQLCHRTVKECSQRVVSIYLCSSHAVMKPCLGTCGMAAVDEVCPQMSGKESCSQDGEQSLAVFAAVLASYKQIHVHVSRTTALKTVQNN